MTELACLLIGIGMILTNWAVFNLRRRVDDLEMSRPVGCAHTDVKNIGTFGHPEYQCQMCHQIVQVEP